MERKLKNSLSINKTLLLLSLLAILSGTFACVIGEIMIPVLVGLLGAIYIFDIKRVFSIVVSSLILALNIAAVLFNISFSLFAPASVILSLILHKGYLTSESKSNTAYIMTVVCTVFTVVSYMLYAMLEQNSFSFDAALEYYTLLVDELRTIFVQAVHDLYASSGMEVAVETIESLFNAQLNLIISYLLIGGFVITGFSMKLFGAVVKKCSEDDTKIKEWRFTASRVYAYFYVALIFASLFTTGADSLFAVSVLNLYNIFLVVFAYIGFKVALEIISHRMRPVISTVIIILLVVVFSSIAAQILAALGVLYVLRRNTAMPEQK